MSAAGLSRGVFYVHLHCDDVNKDIFFEDDDCYDMSQWWWKQWLLITTLTIMTITMSMMTMTMMMVGAGVGDVSFAEIPLGSLELAPQPFRSPASPSSSSS